MEDAMPLAHDQSFGASKQSYIDNNRIPEEVDNRSQVKAVVKQGRDGKQFGIERIKEKSTDNFKEDLKKIERLKWLSRRKKDKGKQMYQHRQTVPEASPQITGKQQQYKRSRIGDFLVTIHVNGARSRRRQPLRYY
jgi:hypothetical protein